MVCKNANSQAFVFNNILVTLYWFNSCYQYNLEIYGPLSQNMVESAILDCILFRGTYSIQCKNSTCIK